MQSSSPVELLEAERASVARVDLLDGLLECLQEGAGALSRDQHLIGHVFRPAWHLGEHAGLAEAQAHRPCRLRELRSREAERRGVGSGEKGSHNFSTPREERNLVQEVCGEASSDPRVP